MSNTDPAGNSAVHLGNDEIARYSRHLIMPEVALAGQKRLKSARVLCIGTGGLGLPVAMYLAAAGVGNLGLIDDDAVDFSNLQRQIIHTTKDVGRKKTNSAKETVSALNPNVAVTVHRGRFGAANAMEIVAGYDIVIDCSDNFATRYVSNDVCVLLGKPLVYGSIYRFEGQVTVFAPSLDGPCYRCMAPQAPPAGETPTCAEGGVLGVLPGIVGTIQAAEAVKLILGRGEPLLGRLLHIDALAMRFREIALRRDPECAVCGKNPTITQPIDSDFACETGGDANAISPAELRDRLQQGGALRLIDVRESHEREICVLAGSESVPFSELNARLSEFDSAEEILFICRNGSRSSTACRLLREAGFSRVRNLAGGLDAWSERIDPDMPRY